MNTQVHYGTCPVCAGTLRMPVDDRNRPYAEKYGWFGYSKEDDKITCTNCGAQKQGGRATGKVRLRADMFPCIHEYTSKNIGRCLNRYTCTHCGDAHDIDSGD